MAGAIDDVTVRNLDGPVAMHHSLRRVADRQEIDVIFGQEIAVGLRVLVDADAYDHQLGQAMMQGQQGRKLLDAGGTPARPEVEQYNLAAVLAEADRLLAVVDGERWGYRAQFPRKLSPVAPRTPHTSNGKNSQYYRMP